VIRPSLRPRTGRFDHFLLSIHPLPIPLAQSSTSAKKIKKEPTIPLDPDDSEEEESLQMFLARHDRLSQEEKEQ
jgi:hypothetical protein